MKVFHPKDKDAFKEQAFSNLVSTQFFASESEKVPLTFHRRVSKVWGKSI
ncbi:hypothetical protein [Vibrio owensii]|nr:hypothetical protein [Vibrio owensii]